jgi:hypothetical protein
MSEVRRTANSLKKASWGPSRPGAESTARSGAHGVVGDRTVGSACAVNQGDLSWCWKEQDRSQSPRSSDEAGNDRGAKGGRKVET